jgi:hypothetical protein
MVMYVGLTRALTYFMDLIDRVFMDYLDKFIIVFIDDILVYSKSEEEHKEHLHLVMQKFWDHRPYARLSKCKFWMKQESFLSHVISEEGIFVDPRKIWDVLRWNASVSVINIRSLLGIVGYYGKFIEGISKITKPMTELLRKDLKFKWMPTVKLDFRNWRSN